MRFFQHPHTAICMDFDAFVDVQCSAIGNVFIVGIVFCIGLGLCNGFWIVRVCFCALNEYKCFLCIFLRILVLFGQCMCDIVVRIPLFVYMFRVFFVWVQSFVGRCGSLYTIFRYGLSILPILCMHYLWMSSSIIGAILLCGMVRGIVLCMSVVYLQGTWKSIIKVLTYWHDLHQNTKSDIPFSLHSNWYITTLTLPAIPLQQRAPKQ